MPQFPEAYSARGFISRIEGDFDNAVADATRATEPRTCPTLLYSGEARLHVQEWDGAKSDLNVAKNKGLDIIALFHNTYGNIAIFEQETGIQLPTDIVSMLTL